MSEAAPYEFLFKADGTPKLDELIEFRRGAAEMPPEKDTFRPTAFLERGTVMHFHWEPKLLYFVDSWSVPDWFTSGSYGVKGRFVNPSGSSISRYSLSGVECTCGNVVTDINPAKPVEETHAEGCSPADRAVVNQRIKDIRLQRLVVGAHLNQTFDAIAPSLGVSQHALSNFVEAVGLDWLKLREIGQHRMAVTIDRLRGCGCSSSEIGEAFGYSSGRIRDLGRRRRMTPLNCTPESVA